MERTQCSRPQPAPRRRQVGQARTLEEALDKVAGLEDVVVETRDAVLSLHEKFGELAVLYKLSHRPLTASHSLSYRDDREKTVLEAVKRRYRSLSDEQRRRFPQLGLDLSRLEIVAGDFEDALGQAREAAAQLDEPTSKAEAHHAAYRAALELKSWDEALAELRQAVAADGRFAIWPSIKYQVERILAPGRSGSLCSARIPISNIGSSSRPSIWPGSTGTSPPSSARPGSSSA